MDRDTAEAVYCREGSDCGRSAGYYADLKPCHLMEQEFFVVQNSGNVCTVAGRYLVTTDERVELFPSGAATLHVCLGAERWETENLSYAYFQSAGRTENSGR